MQQSTSHRIDRTFFESTDVVRIAKSLLGTLLCTNIDGHITTGRIVETEAYRGPDDKACHAYGYRRTPRTEDLYKAPGTGYIYICYGIHHLFNVVTAPEEVPHAVLVRAIEPVSGQEVMEQRRQLESVGYRLTSGPGSLSRALGIASHMTGLDLTEPGSPIWLESQGPVLSGEMIVAGPRVGVESSGECAKWPWRFTIKDNPWISRPKQ